MARWPDGLGDGDPVSSHSTQGTATSFADVEIQNGHYAKKVAVSPRWPPKQRVHVPLGPWDLGTRGTWDRGTLLVAVGDCSDRWSGRPLDRCQPGGTNDT